MKPTNHDELIIKQAFEFYAQCYWQSLGVQKLVNIATYCKQHVPSNKLIGYCDRSLGKFIPNRNTLQGAFIRGSLQRYGLIRPSGHELFRGCVVFPKFNEYNSVISAIGIRLGRVRNGRSTLVYWEMSTPKSFVEHGFSLAQKLINE